MKKLNINHRNLLLLVLSFILLASIVGCGSDDNPAQEAELNVSVSLEEAYDSQIEATINDKISKDRLVVEVISEEGDSKTREVSLNDELESLQFDSLEVGTDYTIEVEIFEEDEESNSEFLIYQGEKEVVLEEDDNLVKVKAMLTEAEKLIVSLSNLADNFESGEITLEPDRYQEDFSADDVNEENEAGIKFEQLAADYYPINIELDGEKLDDLNEIYALPGDRVTKVEIELDDDGESAEIEIDWQVAPDVPELEGDSEDGNIVLEWDDTAKGYLLYRSLSSNDDYQLVQNDLIDDESYVDQDVIVGETYYYKLRAYDEDLLASETSNEVSITIEEPDDPEDPDDPEEYTVTINDAVDGDGEPLSGVKVEYRSNDENEFIKIDSSSLTLEEGSYDFRASKEDYNTWSESIELDSNTEIKPVLTELGGSYMPYSTNPTLGQRVDSPIEIDGENNGEWTDEMLIAIDMANDDPRSLGDNWTMHETPADLSHLWAAWDDENLYLAWQYVDVTKALSPDNAGSGDQIIDQPTIQWLAIDTVTGEGSRYDMWDKNDEEPYWNGTDKPNYQIYIASNLWQGFMSEAIDGEFVDEEDDLINDEDLNVEIAAGSELVVDELWGVNSADDALKYLESNDQDLLLDFLEEDIDEDRATFYEMKLPLELIGNPDLENDGLGVMIGFGEFTVIETIPHDIETLSYPGLNDDESPNSWGEPKDLTAPFARVGSHK